MSRAPDWQRPPTPQELSAYLDGELDSAHQLRIDEWLARRADAAAEVESLRRLALFAEQTRAPEPAWGRSLSRIEAGLAAPRAKREPGRLLRLAGPVASLVAAGLLLLWVLGRPPAPQAPAPVIAEPFSLLSGDDVEIISMDPADSGMLLVGESPWRDSFVPALRSDVLFGSAQPDVDGVVPQYRQPLDPTALPVIVIPTGPGAARETSPP